MNYFSYTNYKKRKLIKFSFPFLPDFSICFLEKVSYTKLKEIFNVLILLLFPSHFDWWICFSYPMGADWHTRPAWRKWLVTVYDDAMAARVPPILYMSSRVFIRIQEVAMVGTGRPRWSPNKICNETRTYSQFLPLWKKACPGALLVHWL